MTQLYNDSEIAALVPAVEGLRRDVDHLFNLSQAQCNRIKDIEDKMFWGKYTKPTKPKTERLTIDHPRAIKAIKMYQSKKYRVDHILKTCKISSCTFYKFLKASNEPLNG